MIMANVTNASTPPQVPTTLQKVYKDQAHPAMEAVPPVPNTPNHPSDKPTPIEPNMLEYNTRMD